MEWLVGIVGFVLATLFTTWLLGFFNQFVPSPERALLCIKNLFQAKTPSAADRFCFVLCWLENDHDGANTSIVAHAFSNVQGVTLARSASVVKTSGAADDWRPAMKRNARDVLECWQADLAVVGLVKESGKALSLWFVPRSGDGTLARGDQPYELDQATLGSDFHEDLRTQLTVLGWAAVAPLAKSETRGQVLKVGLREAAEKLDTLLKGSTIDKPERRASLQWALGNALETLGERERGPARLERAVVAYRAALEGLTRERTPRQWAGTQTNLGNALAILGERERGPVRLEQAVESYHAALEEYTRERVPLEWAGTQNNLGNALRTLGEWKSDSALIEQAIEAHRAALEERTRECVPLDWAATQDSLGTSLAILGAQKHDTAYLKQAMENYHAALEERTRDRVPLGWAMTQHNLGITLRILGERERNTTRLEQAVDSFHAALEEYTQERVPLEWAMTQRNLGNTLHLLSEWAHDTVRLEQAVEAYRAALEVFASDGPPVYCDDVQNNMAHALKMLNERRGTPGLPAEPD